MIPVTRAVTLGTRAAPSTAESTRRAADAALLDVVWRNGRIDMMLSPLWAHVVGVDSSPTARLMHRMDLDLVRCNQQALMSRASCRRRLGTVRADDEPVH